MLFFYIFKINSENKQSPTLSIQALKQNSFLDYFSSRFLPEKFSMLLGIKSKLPFCSHRTVLRALTVQDV